METLSLAIARHLVDLHGGTITAESAGENRRSVFRIALPVVQSGELAATVARIRTAGRPS